MELAPPPPLKMIREGSSPLPPSARSYHSLSEEPLAFHSLQVAGTLASARISEVVFTVSLLDPRPHTVSRFPSLISSGLPPDMRVALEVSERQQSRGAAGCGHRVKAH